MVWGAVIGMAASQVLGMILYSTLVLGKPWMKGNFPGKTITQIKELQGKIGPVSYPLCLASQAALIIALHYFIGSFLKVTSIAVAVKVGVSLTGMAMLVDLPHCLFGQRSLVVFVIDHIYNLLVFVTMSVCLVYLG
ncbi:hypothetical protein ACJMK2_044023 [Sinanodonta woodiana]